MTSIQKKTRRELFDELSEKRLECQETKFQLLDARTAAEVAKALRVEAEDQLAECDLTLQEIRQACRTVCALRYPSEDLDARPPEPDDPPRGCHAIPDITDSKRDNAVFLVNSDDFIRFIRFIYSMAGEG